MDAKEVVLVKEGAYWAQIQALVQNAVVQVFAQVGCYNWIEPYNVVNQHENRGTGFFIDNQGHIVTNAHVVNEAKHVWVQIPILGRQPIQAEVVGFCPDRDLALLKLREDEFRHVVAQLGGIPFLGLGDSDTIMRTHGVLALGYPLGQYRLKSTTGVVSGYASIAGSALIQTTASINPGSSGGPLLDMQGLVIGIVVSSAVPAENVGYAVPVNELRMILDDLLTKRFVRKPLLGVRFSYASDEQAEYLGNPLPPGLYVTNVFKGLLFDQAGVESGDMMYEFNGFHIDAYGDAQVPWSTDKTTLSDLIARIQVGDEAHVVFYRKGKKREINFRFDVGVINPIRPMYPDYEPIEYVMLGGLVIMSLTDNHLPILTQFAPHLLKYQDFENKSEPLLVITHILPGSYAHQLRMLKQGDIVTEINNQPVSTIDQMHGAIQKSKATRLVAVKTKQNVLCVFNLDRLVQDEKRLSKTFAYPIDVALVEKL